MTAAPLSFRPAGPVAIPVASGTPQSVTRLRITRRGRAVLSALVIAPLVAGGLFFGLSTAPAAAGDATAPVPSLASVTVSSGQSLWDIAEAVAPGHDPRDVIADIMAINGLSSANVPAGTTIALPTY